MFGRKKRYSQEVQEMLDSFKLRPLEGQGSLEITYSNGKQETCDFEDLAWKKGVDYDDALTYTWKLLGGEDVVYFEQEGKQVQLREKNHEDLRCQVSASEYEMIR